MSVKAKLVQLYKTVLPLSLREKMRVQYDELDRYIRLDLGIKKQYRYKPVIKTSSTDFGGENPFFSIVLICSNQEEIAKPSFYSTYQSGNTAFDYEVLMSSLTQNFHKDDEAYSPKYAPFLEWIYADTISELVNACNGEYIVFLHNHDLLTKDALVLLYEEIKGNAPDLIYSDNDHFVRKGRYLLPDFKPDFSPETLLSKNYINGLVALKKELLLSLPDPIANENFVYNALLKISERCDFSAKHIPHVLYHKKITKEQSRNPQQISSGIPQEKTKAILEDALLRRNIDAEVIPGRHPDIFRIKRKLKSNPLISILIPFKDKPEILRVCLDSILKHSTYSNFEIIGINNNSTGAGTFEMMKEYTALDARIRFIDLNIPFNFSTLNNRAAEVSNGEHLILLNNDIEIITPDWIESLLEFSQEKTIGVVGAKLYYPNDLVQHAGVFIGIGGVGGHGHKMYHRNDYGYFGRLQFAQNVSALTAACFMVKKRIYEEVGGLDEKNFEIAFNDVDFCLKVSYKGYQNIFTPYCEAYHYESISRGAENTPEKLARFRREIDAFKQLHKDILHKGDPYYNRNLSQKFEDFSLQ